MSTFASIEENPVVMRTVVEHQYYDTYFDFVTYEDAKDMGIAALTKHLAHLCYAECRDDFDMEDRALAVKHAAKALYDLTKETH